ncbi:hypothetical protein GCM10010836_28560 [Aminobacter aminovorans]
MEKSIPETYKVGGRRVKRPTGLPRDSSLRIVKAPGKMLSCREAQTVTPNIGVAAAMRHGNAAVHATIFMRPTPCLGGRDPSQPPSALYGRGGLRRDDTVKV